MASPDDEAYPSSSLWNDVDIAEEEDDHHTKEEDEEDESTTRKVRFHSRRKVVSYPSESSFTTSNNTNTNNTNNNNIIRHSQTNTTEEVPHTPPPRSWVQKAQSVQRYTPRFAPPASTTGNEDSDEDGDGDDEENDVIVKDEDEDEEDEVVVIKKEEEKEKDALIAELMQAKAELQQEVDRVTQASQMLEKASNALEENKRHLHNTVLDMRNLLRVLTRSSGKVAGMLVVVRVLNDVFVIPRSLLSAPAAAIITTFGLLHTIIYAYILRRKRKWRWVWPGLAGAITCACMAVVWGRSTSTRLAWPMVVAAGSLMGILSSPSS